MDYFRKFFSDFVQKVFHGSIRKLSWEFIFIKSKILPAICFRKSKVLNAFRIFAKDFYETSFNSKPNRQIFLQIFFQEILQIFLQTFLQKIFYGFYGYLQKLLLKTMHKIFQGFLQKLFQYVLKKFPLGMVQIYPREFVQKFNKKFVFRKFSIDFFLNLLLELLQKLFQGVN